MKDPTGMRLGLVVVLAFLVVFGLILTTQSNRYEVSPPTASIEGPGPPGGRGHAISRATFGETTAREWQQRRPLPGRSRQALEAEERPPSAPSSSVDPLERRQAGRRDVPDGREARSADPQHRVADRTAVDGPGSRPASEIEAEPAPAVPQIPQRDDRAPGRPPKPATEAPKRAPRSTPKTRPQDLRFPGELPDGGLRTARKGAPRTSRFVQTGTVDARVTAAVYVIKPRDNLIKICKAVYGTSDRGVVQALYEANRDRVKNKNHVVVGQRLRIPAWPPDTAERIPRRIPLSQRAVVSKTAPSTIKLPVQPVDRPRVGSDTANAGGRGSRKGARKETAGRGRTQTRSTRAERYRWHRVRRNESLSTIARDKLGNGRRWYAIWKLNKGRLRRPDSLPAGVRIKVPLAVPATGRTVLAAEHEETFEGAL